MRYSPEEALRRAKKSVQILLYIAESKNPIFRGVKAKNVRVNTAGVYNSLNFETIIPFSVEDPDHGSLCMKLDEILRAILDIFTKYELSSTIDFNLKTDDMGDDMVGLFIVCDYKWENHEDIQNSQAVYAYEYNFYTEEES